MTDERWFSLTLFEQLSNISGDVKRFIDTREAYSAGREKEDYSGFYFDRIVEYVNKTLDDPKNKGREAELLDEVGEIKRYIKGEVSKEYVMTYWDQFTRAIS